MTAHKDITGQRFGRLTAVRRVGTRKKDSLWLCRCDDGNEIVTRLSRLMIGKTRSCGCINKERIAQGHVTHGASKTRAYKAYLNAKRRCLDLNHISFHNYGGRGVEFRFASFVMLYAELGDCPPGMTLGRIKDSDEEPGHYEPGNVQWETWEEQANKKRNNRKITAFGKTANLSQWARLFSINATALHKRLKSGLSPERALLDQGAMKDRIVVTNNASFEERVELIRRMDAYQAMTPGERRDAQRARIKAVWNAMDELPIRRSGMTTAALEFHQSNGN